jgi:hypothetical protein
VEAQHPWKTLQLVNEWIRFSDAKAAAVLAGSGLLGGLVVHSVPSYQQFGDHLVRSALLILALVCVVTSFLLALMALTPILRAEERPSLVYFRHIAEDYSTDRETFVARFIALAGEEEEFQRQLAEQIWANSIIAKRKFERVRWGVRFLGVAMTCVGSSVLVARLWN